MIFVMMCLEFVSFINSLYLVIFFQPGKFIYFSYGKFFLNYFILCYKLIYHSTPLGAELIMLGMRRGGKKKKGLGLGK